MSRRKFHFSEGSSKKFWAIEVSGTSQTVTFGKIGTTGQTQTKKFDSEAETAKATDKLIAEKVKKGYKEVASGTKNSGAPAAKVKTAEDKRPATKPKPKNAKAVQSGTSKMNYSKPASRVELVSIGAGGVTIDQLLTEKLSPKDNPKR
jgi:predicted DNA-binding WGR domain protein